jgi:hypothetical protein
MKLPPDPTDKQIAEHNRYVEYVRDSMPDSWLEYSEELADAAERLWHVRSDRMTLSVKHSGRDDTDHIETAPAQPRAYVLLAALALENVLKGLLIAHDPSLITSGSIPGRLRNHRLTSLAKQVPALELSTRDRGVLSVCEEGFPSWSRYPVPLRSEDHHEVSIVPATFHNTFKDLHSRLCRSLHELIRNGWDSGVGAGILSSGSVRYGDRLDLTEAFPWVKPPKGR